MLAMAKVNNKNTRAMSHEHMHINLIFLLLTLNVYLSVAHKINSIKQLKMSKSTWFKEPVNH